MDPTDRSNSSVAILGSYKLSCFLREVGNRNYVAPVTGSDQIRFSPLYLNVQVLELLLAVRKLLSHSCAGISVERGQFFGCWWVEDSMSSSKGNPPAVTHCTVMVLSLFWRLRSNVAWLTWVEGKCERCPWSVWCSADSVGCHGSSDRLLRQTSGLPRLSVSFLKSNSCCYQPFKVIAGYYSKWDIIVNMLK